MSILVAEIGWNFIGDLSLAKRMILKAKKSGADAVKFQVWNPEHFKKGNGTPMVEEIYIRKLLSEKNINY